MTITEVLNTKMYRRNQSLLSRDLGVSRTTVMTYIGDTEGKHHFVRKSGDTVELFTNQTNKIERRFGV